MKKLTQVFILSSMSTFILLQSGYSQARELLTILEPLARHIQFSIDKALDNLEDSLENHYGDTVKKCQDVKQFFVSTKSLFKAFDGLISLTYECLARYENLSSLYDMAEEEEARATEYTIHKTAHHVIVAIPVGAAEPGDIEIAIDGTILTACISLDSGAKAVRVSEHTITLFSHATTMEKIQATAQEKTTVSGISSMSTRYVHCPLSTHIEVNEVKAFYEEAEAQDPDTEEKEYVLLLAFPKSTVQRVALGTDISVLNSML